MCVQAQTRTHRQIRRHRHRHRHRHKHTHRHRHKGTAAHRIINGYNSNRISILCRASINQTEVAQYFSEYANCSKCQHAHSDQYYGYTCCRATNDARIYTYTYICLFLVLKDACSMKQFTCVYECTCMHTGI